MHRLILSGMTTTLSAKGQILIPREYRDELRLRAGDGLRVRRDGQRLILEKIARSRRRARLIRRKGQLPTIVVPPGSGFLTTSKVKELEREMWATLGWPAGTKR